MSTLFAIAYLPPTDYILRAIELGKIKIDAHEHFVKQSYRSRCSIYGPNGKQDLIIPIRHQNLFSIPITEVKISNDSRWQTIHWRSIEAAYKNAPYFEFFEDTFRIYFEKKFDSLFEFNLELITEIFKAKKKSVEISFTEQYEASPENNTDFREFYHPRKIVASNLKYRQVFEEKHGFIDGLSSIDWLFNSR